MAGKKYSRFIIRFFVALSLLTLFLLGDFTAFVLVYLLVCIGMSVRTLYVPFSNPMKVLLISFYVCVMMLQIAFDTLVIYEASKNLMFIKIIGVLLVLLPLYIEEMAISYCPEVLYPPPVREPLVISFSELSRSREKLWDMMDKLQQSGKVLNRENMTEIFTDLPRHSSFRYIANGRLTNDYFACAYDSLEEPYLYLVISNTGSAASQVISLFTQKQYNHASLAFDEDLKTIVSYNGGERLYPPGLNREMLAYFCKQEDSSIMVYRLSVTWEQKKKILDKVREIDQEGSAYNLMGLVLKYSHRPNIMFCSQFVYQMLQYGGVAYFEKKPELVTPMDLVELDYRRRLEFVYDMRLSQPPEPQKQPSWTGEADRRENVSG